MKTFGTFHAAIDDVGKQLKYFSYEVHPSRWQSTDVSARPEAKMRECLNLSFSVMINGEDLQLLAEDIEPNLPWANDHFLERVGGEPLNPGVQWTNWPWAFSADRHRKESGRKFSHTYMERYWPKLAGYSDEDRAKGYRLVSETKTERVRPHHGIRYRYGDLKDVIELLTRDPLTRQAFLPVWFPEDTGVVHGERVPCTLGYHFILRNDYFHHTYYIRSCDFFRHFRDDLYLSVRLHLWILDRLRERADNGIDACRTWDSVNPGLFTFHCVSMHCFINDWNHLFGAKAAKAS